MKGSGQKIITPKNIKLFKSEAKIQRRDFLKSFTMGCFAMGTGASTLLKNKPLLSFSTLGCPDWSFEQILDFATINHFGGIELRCIQREFDLNKCEPFNSSENITSTIKLLKKNKIKIVDICTSSQMHFPDGEERDKNIEEAKKSVELAHQLNCPYIRVLPDKFTVGRCKKDIFSSIIKNLNYLGHYAKAKKVMVLLETHGDIVTSNDYLEIMNGTSHNNVGLVWDVTNMWSITREPVDMVYANLKKHIRHVHVRDLKIEENKETCVLMGKGNTPIFLALDILHKENFKGFYSLEWEKYWFPEIEEPEIAIADYAKAMRRHFNL